MQKAPFLVRNAVVSIVLAAIFGVPIVSGVINDSGGSVASYGTLIGFGLLAAFALYVIVQKNRYNKLHPVNMVCTTCGYHGVPEKTTRGSFIMELILWLIFIVPGFIYSIWRVTTKEGVCPKCKNKTMIPTDTPIGQKLTAQKN